MDRLASAPGIRRVSRGWGLLLWIAVWIANILLAALSQHVLRHRLAGPGLCVLVALLPAMPIVLGLVLFVFLLRRMDEFRRLLTLAAFALASAIVGIVVYGWSLLAFVGAPAPQPVWILPAQLALWSALMLAARLRFP